MRMTISLDLKPLKAMQKKLKTLETTSVEVGFFPEDQYGPENENLPVAAVAQMQQLGADKYPSRPFFYNTVEDRRTLAMIAYKMRQLVKTRVLSTGGHIAAGLKEVGEFLAEEVRFSIVDYPGRNSDAWASVKGFNDPLRYTDKMLNSVKVKIKK